jgi:hypothetical protein
MYIYIYLCNSITSCEQIRRQKWINKTNSNARGMPWQRVVRVLGGVGMDIIKGEVYMRLYEYH